ncbi:MULTISPECIES: AI-2E family transporter [Butyricimonas]|uniref:AI-2E family transporter n=1 Tax=Butyricimonas TaxID=574697 RepID=UPI0007FB20A6|nr:MULTISPECIES: AI-2E family transporter [Butyricimonas]
MNNIGKYCLGGLALLVVGFLCWYFSSIIAYILVAVVLSFFGHPIIDLLGKVKIKGKRMPNGLRAGIALVCIWFVLVLFFYTVIPLVSQEFQSLSDISITNIVNKLEDPLADLEEGLKHFGIIDANQDIKEYIVKNLKSVVDVTQIQNLFGSLAGTISSIFIALFSVTFMAFFFLKDSNLFYKMLLAVVPARYGEGVGKALDSIQRLLVRYFIGITFEVLIVMGLNILGLTIIGLPFNNAVLIGLITGVTNVIPYIGPLIGAAFGLSVGIATNVDVDFYMVVFPLLIYMSIVFIITQLIDNVVLQPLIYGNSVHAHPMEIFLVILIAGNLAGIPGMILAIPGYTVLRVILREFFNKYRLVKSLTKSLELPDEETRL